jgi:hypothetical protein
MHYVISASAVAAPAALEEVDELLGDLHKLTEGGLGDPADGGWTHQF